jgi:uncharacterized protein YeaO (DUF488 family)
MHVSLKRVYEAPSPKDGMRVLLERLWPRGLKKGEAAIDLWLKDVAPSAWLRKWFGHTPRRGGNSKIGTGRSCGREGNLSKS